MKSVKRIFLPVLAIFMVLALFTGCSDQKRKDALAGTYMIVLTDSEQQVNALLESIDACDEEIALVNKHSLYSVQLLTLTADGKYSFSYDAESTKIYVRSFYENYFNALYNGRTTLNKVFNKTFDDMSQTEFQQYYADLYGYDSYSDLVDALVLRAYQYDKLALPWEYGSYTTEKGKIFCTPDGSPENTETYIVYTLEKNVLTLTYTDTTDYYTRIN